MLRNYLTVAIRNLLRNRIYSAINILGLGLGIGTCILILAAVQYQFSFDQHHEHADRIYRILRSTKVSGTEADATPGTLGPLGSALQDDFPEIERTVRLFSRGMFVRYEDKGFRQRVCLADPGILEVFTFPLVKGDPSTALKEPYSALITEEMARRYFGDQDPIGELLTLDYRWFKGAHKVDRPPIYKITGILQNMPRTSTYELTFDFLASTIPSNEVTQNVWEKWRPESNWRPLLTYVLLKEGHAPQQLERKLPEFVARHLGESASEHTTYYLQPLTRIHLYSSVDYNLPGQGVVFYLYVFASIALLVLLIACINFANLATARAANRAREVGMRKVVGAYRRQLAGQFLGESICFALLALLVGIGLANLFLSPLNAFTNSEMSLDLASNAALVFGMLAITLLAGIVAGSYPALLLSRFRPVEALEGSLTFGSKRVLLRRGLVIFQFAAAVVMVVAMVVVNRQMIYVSTKDLGFKKEQVIVLPIFRDRPSLRHRQAAVKQEFLGHPNILKASASVPPIWGNDPVMFHPEGDLEEAWNMYVFVADEDFLDLYEIELVAGRNLSKEGDSLEEFLVNETAAAQLGWADPIGKRIEYLAYEKKGTVVGVVKDFHHMSLHDRIGPVVILKRDYGVHWLALKLRKEDIPGTLDFLESKWGQFVPSHPFEFMFVEDGWSQMYAEEMVFGRLLEIFSVVATLVACLGLFGLTLFAIQARTKEIGVRKVLGASVAGIAVLVSKSFLRLVVIANLIAWPVAYYMAEQWLQGFAYRMDLGAGEFLGGSVLALFIAATTVSYHSLRAATRNPVHALRHE